MLNFNHLRLFDATVRAGSISGAAAALRLSQPALSKQIRELEAALEVELLERLPRGVRPTAAGALLAGYSRRLFALGEEAEAALGELHGLRRGRLRLGASMTIGVYLAPAMLAAFRQRWPGIEVACAVENTDTIQQALMDAELDLGLTEGPGQWDAELESRVFRRDELIVVARDAPASLPLRQLVLLPWVMREAGSGTRAVIEAALAKRGCRVEPAWTFNNPEAVKQAVLAGCGVAIMPRLAVADELAHGRMRQVRVPGLRLQRSLQLQWRRGRPRSAALDAFLAYCTGPK